MPCLALPCLALPCLAFPRFQGCLPSYCNECAAAASEADRHFAFGPGTGDGDADDLQSTTSPTLAMEYLYEYGVCAGWSRDDACRAATGLPSLRRRPTQRARNIAALRLLLLPPSQPTCSHVHAEPIAPSNSSQRLRGRRRPQGPPSRAWYHGSPVAGVDEKRRGAHLLSARCRKRAAAEPSADTWSKEREQRSFTNGAGRQAGKLPAPSYECRSGGDVDSGQAREEEREASRQTDGSSSKSPANGRAPLQGQRWAGKGGGRRRLQGVPCAVPDASPISDACPATGNEHVAWCGRLPQIPPWQSAVTRLVLQPVRLSTSYYTRRRKNVRTWGLTVVRRSKTAVRCSSSPQLVAAAKCTYVLYSTVITSNCRPAGLGIHGSICAACSRQVDGRAAEWPGTGTQRKPVPAARAPPLQRFWPRPGQGSVRRGTHIFVSRHQVAPSRARRTTSITATSPSSTAASGRTSWFFRSSAGPLPRGRAARLVRHPNPVARGCQGRNRPRTNHNVSQ